MQISYQIIEQIRNNIKVSTYNLVNYNHEYKTFNEKALRKAVIEARRLSDQLNRFSL